MLLKLTSSQSGKLCGSFDLQFIAPEAELIVKTEQNWLYKTYSFRQHGKDPASHRIYVHMSGVSVSLLFP